MAKRRHSELAAGLFMLAAIIAGVGTLLWLGSTSILQGAKDRIYFWVPQSKGMLGITVGSAIKYNDAYLGRITSIQPQPDKGRTLYEGQLDCAGQQIHSNAAARVSADLLGTAAIAMESYGTPQAPPAGADNPIPLAPGPIQSALDDLAASAASVRQIAASLAQETDRDKAASLLAKVHTMADDLARISGAVAKEADLANQQGLLTGLKATLGNLQKGSENVLLVTDRVKAEADPARKESLLAELHTAMADINKASADVAGMIQKVRPDAEHISAQLRQYVDKDVGEILLGLRKSNNELLGVMNDLRAVSGGARELLTANRPAIEDIIVSLKGMADNLDAAAQEIRRNPWRLLQKPTPEEVARQNVYDAARVFAEGAGDLRDALAQLQALQQSRAAATAPAGTQPGTRPAGATQPGATQPADDETLKRIRQRIGAAFERLSKIEEMLWKQASK